VSSSPRSELQSESRRICVTPVRNEAWIIDRFLAAARSWATDVIVADQGSTDGTLQRLQGTPGVTTVINDSPVFDEQHRQQLLLTHARRVPGRRVLIGLDADEALSANSVESSEWERIEKATPGTILRFRWVNILPGFEKAWIPPHRISCGFVDDGACHEGKRIHSPRVPNPPGAPVIDLDEIVVLHFQYVSWERMLSKQRWYQAWEWTQHRQKGALAVFREYNHMFGSWDSSEIHPVQPQWLEGYDAAGIGYRNLVKETVTWWDRAIVDILREQGPRALRKIAIWDQDWNAVATTIGRDDIDFSDPRSFGERLAHRVLKLTQHRRGALSTRAFERLLRMNGW